MVNNDVYTIVDSKYADIGIDVSCDIVDINEEEERSLNRSLRYASFNR